MTVNQLHKQLIALMAAGHARKNVCISKGTFRHNCESDGVTILPVEVAEMDWVPLSDDDGGTATTKAGLERGSWNLVLSGNLYERTQASEGVKPT